MKSRLAYMWDAYRTIARAYFGNRCQRCGTNRGRLEVHHIDGDWTNNSLSNIILLCTRCHKISEQRAIRKIVEVKITRNSEIKAPFPYLENCEEITFTARVQANRRFAIPSAVREALDIEPGDYVEVRVKKLSIKPKGYPLTR